MLTTIYHGYIGFAMTLFTVVGALSVCVIACIILAMLANTLQDLLIAFKDNWDEYRFFIYHQANFELWLDSNGYKMEYDEEHDRARWVKDDKK